MRTTCLVAAALTLFDLSSAHAQRRVRIGPTYSSVSLEDGSGSSHSFSSYGGSVALITGDEGETGLTIARYNDLSTDKGLRRLSLYALDSYYYPVGTRGVVAPFALTALGLARVTERDSGATPRRRAPSPSRSTWPRSASPLVALPLVATRMRCSSPLLTRRPFVPRGGGCMGRSACCSPVCIHRGLTGASPREPTAAWVPTSTAGG